MLLSAEPQRQGGRGTPRVSQTAGGPPHCVPTGRAATAQTLTRTGRFQGVRSDTNSCYVVQARGAVWRRPAKEFGG